MINFIIYFSTARTWLPHIKIIIPLACSPDPLEAPSSHVDRLLLKKKKIPGEHGKGSFFLEEHKLLGYQDTYVELSVIFKVFNPSGPLKSFNMSTSRGWRCPLMIIEWSGPPRSLDANSCSVPERMVWSSAPIRARPTHTVPSVIAALKERTQDKPWNQSSQSFQSNLIQFPISACQS